MILIGLSYLVPALYNLVFGGYRKHAGQTTTRRTEDFAQEGIEMDPLPRPGILCISLIILLLTDLASLDAIPTHSCAVSRTSTIGRFVLSPASWVFFDARQAEMGAPAAQEQAVSIVYRTSMDSLDKTLAEVSHAQRKRRRKGDNRVTNSESPQFTLRCEEEQFERYR